MAQLSILSMFAGVFIGEMIYRLHETVKSLRKNDATRTKRTHLKSETDKHEELKGEKKSLCLGLLVSSVVPVLFWAAALIDSLVFPYLCAGVFLIFRSFGFFTSPVDREDYAQTQEPDTGAVLAID